MSKIITQGLPYKAHSNADLPKDAESQGGRQVAWQKVLAFHCEGKCVSLHALNRSNGQA